MPTPRRISSGKNSSDSLKDIADSLEKIALYLEVIAEKINPDAFDKEDNQ